MCWAILCESGGKLWFGVFLLMRWCEVGLYYLYLHLIMGLKQEDFFFILHGILADMEEVTELQPVPDAHVPVMKLKFDGVSIDLLYASVSLLVVPEVSNFVDIGSFAGVWRWHFMRSVVSFSLLYVN